MCTQLLVCVFYYECVCWLYLLMRASPLSLWQKTGMGTPQLRCLEMHQYVRLSSMVSRLLLADSGKTRTFCRASCKIPHIDFFRQNWKCEALPLTGRNEVSGTEEKTNLVQII